MWKLIIVLYWIDPNGDVQQEAREHRAMFETAAQCYEGARIMFERVEMVDNARALSALCVRDGEDGRDA